MVKRFMYLASATLLLAVSACTDDAATKPAKPDDKTAPVSCAPEKEEAPVTLKGTNPSSDDTKKVTLMTHGSFATTDGIFDSFTEKTGIEVELLESGDAGEMVSQALLTTKNPTADVMYGIDSTFLCRGTRGGLFLPYQAASIDDVPSELRLAENDLATPIDVGDVCLNYSKAAFADSAPPKNLDDLIETPYKGMFVTENPETSSPGFAFLLATIAEYGDNWEDYWKDLAANDVAVSSGWEDAYNETFDSGSGEGERNIVTSYASSPVADVLYSEPPRTEPAIGVIASSCYRQVEFAGILSGTDHPTAAAQLIDFLLAPTFQADIPLNMFVEPANSTVELPPEYASHRVEVTEPLSLSPAEIEAGRDEWTERWTEIVQR